MVFECSVLKLKKYSNMLKLNKNTEVPQRKRQISDVLVSGMSKLKGFVMQHVESQTPYQSVADNKHSQQCNL